MVCKGNYFKSAAEFIGVVEDWGFIVYETVIAAIARDMSVIVKQSPPGNLSLREIASVAICKVSSQ
ncbi:hypothetical protein ACFL5V_00300 [Fibrobacterota bacterium]